MNQTKGVLVPPAYQIFLKVRPPLLFSLSNIGLTLKKKMAAHSSILTWEIPWTEEPDSPWGRKRIGHDLATKQPQKEKFYCFARQRGTQWAHAPQNCMSPTWEDLERRRFIAMVQGGVANKD